MTTSPAFSLKPGGACVVTKKKSTVREAGKQAISLKLPAMGRNQINFEKHAWPHASGAERGRQAQRLAARCGRSGAAATTGHQAAADVATPAAMTRFARPK
jgi:hypothetical protein